MFQMGRFLTKLCSSIPMLSQNRGGLQPSNSIEQGPRNVGTMAMALCFFACVELWQHLTVQPQNGSVLRTSRSPHLLHPFQKHLLWTQALVALGLGPEPLEDVEKLVKTLQSYVLVVVGPAASEFWCRQPSDSDSTPHVQAICAFCETFGLHGSCEHTHAAFLDLELISLQAPTFPSRQKKIPVSEQDSVPILLPSRSARQPAQLSSPRQAALRPHNDPGLAACFIRWICGGLRSSSNISLLSSLLPFRSQMLAWQRPRSVWNYGAHAASCATVALPTGWGLK